MSDAATRGRRSRARGTKLELAVALKLELAGWVVASRRTVKGAGDLLASRETAPLRDRAGPEVRLIEVKGTSSSPWERFGPVARRELLEAAHAAGATAWLAWRRKGAREITWIGEDEFPGGQNGK